MARRAVEEAITIPTLGTLTVELQAKTSKLQSGLKSAAVGLGVLTVAAGYAFKQFEDSEKVTRQTGAVLKSTGGAAHVTAGHVADLAGALAKTSGIDDELIQSGENLLATFTSVRNEVGKGNQIFDQATKTALDMSVALGQDMKSSTIQLGKALNDPIKGITALRRVGVSFTGQQQDQIESLVKHNRLLDAQKLILGELSKEFGGSATAQATASGKLSVALGNLAEGFGKILAPAITAVSGLLAGLASAMSKSPEVMKLVTAAIFGLTAAFVALKIAALVSGGAVTATGFAVAGIVAAVVIAAVLIIRHWKQISAAFSAAFQFIKRNWATILIVLTGPIGLATVAIVKNWNRIKDVALAVFGVVASAFTHMVGAIRGAIAILGSGISWMIGFLKAAFGWISKVIGGISRVAGAIGRLPGKAFHAIPGFQHGGVMPRTGLALLHAGETVIPSYAGASRVGGPMAITVVLEVDGKELARTTRDNMLKLKGSRTTLGLA